MIQYTLRLQYGDLYQGKDFFFEIETEIEMPVFPRTGEVIFIGELNGNGDYCNIVQVWHHPTEKKVIAEVQLQAGYIWVALEAWRKIPGDWRFNEQSRGVKEKFLYFVEHPDELVEHPDELQ